MKQRLKYGFAAILTIVMAMSFCRAQDCLTVFEVNAGADIDVCDGGSVDLSGAIGGQATRAEWLGGKGTFVQGRNKLNVEYIPAPEETGKSVTLTLSAGNPKLNCPAVTSNVTITVNIQPKANAGSNQSVCSGDEVKLNGTIAGKAKLIKWITDGTGSFDDDSRLNAAYVPSEKDIEKGVIILSLIATPYGACMPDTSTMAVTIDKNAEFTTASEVISTGGPVELHISPKNELSSIVWNTSASGSFEKKSFSTWEYSPSLKDMQGGAIALQVTVTDKSKRCSKKKEVTLRFRNKSE